MNLINKFDAVSSVQYVKKGGISWKHWGSLCKPTLICHLKKLYAKSFDCRQALTRLQNRSVANRPCNWMMDHRQVDGDFLRKTIFKMRIIFNLEEGKFTSVPSATHARVKMQLTSMVYVIATCKPTFYGLNWSEWMWIIFGFNETMQPVTVWSK